MTKREILERLRAAYNSPGSELRAAVWNVLVEIDNDVTDEVTATEDREVLAAEVVKLNQDRERLKAELVAFRSGADADKGPKITLRPTHVSGIMIAWRAVFQGFPARPGRLDATAGSRRFVLEEIERQMRRHDETRGEPKPTHDPFDGRITPEPPDPGRPFTDDEKQRNLQGRIHDLEDRVAALERPNIKGLCTRLEKSLALIDNGG